MALRKKSHTRDCPPGAPVIQSLYGLLDMSEVFRTAEVRETDTTMFAWWMLCEGTAISAPTSPMDRCGRCGMATIS